MNNLFLSFIITALAGFSTLLGTLAIFFNRRGRERLICCSLIFSSSIMLFISIFDLIPNSFSYLNSIYEIIPSLLIDIIYILFGFIFIFCINKLFKSETSLYKVGMISMIALMIHNIPEGIITFLTTTKDIKLGLSLAISITLHNIPEGISIFIPLYYGSGSKKKAFLYTFLAGFSEFLGAILSWLFLSNLVNDYFFSFMFAITSGIMIYISICELLPESFKYKNKKELTFFYILGIIVMLISEYFL